MSRATAHFSPKVRRSIGHQRLTVKGRRNGNILFALTAFALVIGTASLVWLQHQEQAERNLAEQQAVPVIEKQTISTRAVYPQPGIKMVSYRDAFDGASCRMWLQEGELKVATCTKP